MVIRADRKPTVRRFPMRAPSRLVLAAITVLALLAAVPAAAEEAPATVPADSAATEVAEAAAAPVLLGGCEAAAVYTPVDSEPRGDWLDAFREDRVTPIYGQGFCPSPCEYRCPGFPLCPEYQKCSVSCQNGCCVYSG
jgi:hypothetical protein